MYIKISKVIVDQIHCEPELNWHVSPRKCWVALPLGGPEPQGRLVYHEAVHENLYCYFQNHVRNS